MFLMAVMIPNWWRTHGHCGERSDVESPPRAGLSRQVLHRLRAEVLDKAQQGTGRTFPQDL
jgi:hypothetical protein